MAVLALAAAGSYLGAAGAVAAGAVQGGFLATAAGSVGGLIGSTIGGFIDNALFGSTQRLPDVVGPRLADTGVQVSTYGSTLPIVFGRVRMAGNVIWSAGIREEEVRTTTEQSSGGGGKGGGGGGGTATQTTITYNYYITLAIAICEGKIDEVTRVWADSKPLSQDILDSGNDKYNVYLGDETQMPDTIMQAYLGSGNVPAYRGLAYVVIKDFPLADYGNRIPNFTFEVVRTVKDSPSVEELVKDIVMIPGTGEYVYETDIVTKRNGERLPNGVFVSGGTTDEANMHNFDNIADVKKSIDNMLKTFPNLDRVSVVVSWFSTSKFLASSTIIPKVEYGNTTTDYSKAWSVAGVTRGTAQLVKRLANGNLNYGGTPSDASIINLCSELHARGLEVMFYPFLAIDTVGNEGGGEEAKPWRGRMVPTSTSEVNNWFTKTNGYNAHIMHYANLQVGGVYLKDKIKRFVIGSEMRGITQYMPSAGVFPGVTNFKSLAASVKAAVGSNVKVGYAADWSEYHSVNGWFNMDTLWTDTNIDFIGIDYYMPITPDLPQSAINVPTIKSYFENGEGWAYYYTDSEARTGLTAYSPADGTSPYSWKNIENWWKLSAHTNPDSSNNWTAKAKPVIFTEYGFASVDGTANQPNVFVDPNSIENYYPRGSKGRVDFKAQRDAIRAMLEYWQAQNAETGNANFVPEMYLWTWDARPFPHFPDLTNYWSDGGNWKTGHWVNGKLGGSTLGKIVADLLERVGLDNTYYDTSRLTNIVEGYLNTRVMPLRSWLEQLQSVYMFDVVESDGVLKFVPRAGQVVKSLTQDDIMPVKSGQSETLVNIDRKQELELPQEVAVTFLDRSKNFQNNTQISQRQTVNAVDKQQINVPIVLGIQEAKIVADIRLYNQWVSRNSFQFTLSNKHITLEPTDIISLTINGVSHIVRLTNVGISKAGMLVCEGVSEDVSSYDFYTPPASSVVTQQEGLTIPTTDLVFMDIPLLPGEVDVNYGTLRIASAPSNIENWNGSIIYRSNDGGEAGGNTWQIVGNTIANAVVGVTLTDLGACLLPDTWDYANTLDVFFKIGEEQVVSGTEEAVLNGANACVIGDEIIQFKTATILDSNPKKIRLSGLLRGRLGTEFAAKVLHPYGADFVMLTTATTKVPMPYNLIGSMRYYKGVSVGSNLQLTDEESFIYNGVAFKPYSVVELQGVKSGNDWLISWVRRTRTGGELRDTIGTVPLNEESEKYEIDIMNGATVVKTYTSTTPGYTYTQAQQIADFGSVQTSIQVRIYQISAIVGRGRVASATF